jgi:hypothetical protein
LEESAEETKVYGIAVNITRPAKNEEEVEVEKKHVSAENMRDMIEPLKKIIVETLCGQNISKIR